MTDQGVRRLKAIMFTDIKGFSSMMGENENRTVRLVQEHRDLVREVLPEFGGDESNTMGDAFVVLFDSALHAVQCALEIQARLKVMNAERSKDEQVWIRIGVHLGDVIMADGDIYGDGVNIAARVEPKAEPGGVCITQDVLGQVRHKIDALAVSIGRPQLKNIHHPPELFHLKPAGQHAAEADACAQPLTSSSQRKKWVVWLIVTAWAPIFPLSVPDKGQTLGHMMVLTFGVSPENASLAGWSLAIGLACLFGLCIYLLGRAWSSGRKNRWFHGDGLIIAGLASFGLFVYQYARYVAHLDVATQAARHYREPGRGLAFANELASATAGYLNTTALISYVFTTLVALILIGLWFVPRYNSNPRWWLRVVGLFLSGMGVLALFIIVLPEPLVEAGSVRFLGLFCFLWMLGATTIGFCIRGNPRVEPERSRSMGTSLLALQLTGLGLIFLVAVSMVAGYVAVFQLWEGAEAAERMPQMAFAVKTVNNWAIVLLCLCGILMALVAVWFPKNLLLSGKLGRKTHLKHWAGLLVLLTLASAYPLSQISAFSRFLFEQKVAFTSQSMLPGGEFYLDAQARTWGDLTIERFVQRLKGNDSQGPFGARIPPKKLFEALRSESDCLGLVAAQFDSLSSNPENSEALAAFLAKPVRCLSPAQARIYCESFGARLPTPAEWSDTLGSVEPSSPEAPRPAGAPGFRRTASQEWAMEIQHATAGFSSMGGPGGQALVSAKAGAESTSFRCAFSF